MGKSFAVCCINTNYFPIYVCCVLPAVIILVVLYSDDRKDLSIYEGSDDLSAFDDLVDMDYRGA